LDLDDKRNYQPFQEEAMTSVPRLEFVAEEEWTVDVYDLKVEWDDAAWSEFTADPAGFLRRQIESAYRLQPRILSAVNRVLIGEELLDPKGPPPNMRCHHKKTPPSQYSEHEVVGRLGPGCE
jgi:hypothetical protein